MNNHNEMKIRNENQIIECLAAYISKDYLRYHRREEDDFDFYSPDNSIGLEVTIALRPGQKRMLAFERASKKPHIVHKKAIEDGYALPLIGESIPPSMMAVHDDYQSVLQVVIQAIETKEKKRAEKINRTPADIFQLAVCVPLTDKIEVNWERHSEQLRKCFIQTGFSRMYLITPFSIYVFDKNREIVKVDRLKKS